MLEGAEVRALSRIKVKFFHTFLYGPDFVNWRHRDVHTRKGQMITVACVSSRSLRSSEQGFLVDL